MATGVNSFSYSGLPALASAMALAMYLAVYVTGLSPFIVLFPLIVSGFFLAMDDVEPVPSRVGQNHDPIHVATALLFVSVILSTLFSYSIGASLEAAAVLFPGLLIAHVLSQILPRHSKIVVWGLVIMVFVAAMVSLSILEGSPNTDPGEAFQLGKTPGLVVPNDMVLGVIFSPLILHCIITERRLGLKIVAGAILLVLLVSLYYVKSRSCLLVAFVVFGLYLHHYFPRYFVLRLLAVLVALIVLDTVFTLGVVQNFALILEESTRLAIWYAALDSIQEHPIVGYGPAQFYIAYEQVISSPSLPDWLVLDPRGVPWAHNIYLEALTERGVVGFLVFMFLLFQVHSRLYVKFRSTNSDRPSLNLAIYVAFVAFLLAGVFELTLQRIWVANVLFVFIGFALWNNNLKTAIPVKTGSDRT